MATSEVLDSAQVNHSIALTRFANGEAKKINPYLLQIINYLDARIKREGETIASKVKLDKLIADATKRMNSIYSEYQREEFNPMLPQVSQQELDFQARAVNSVVVDYESVIPDNKQAIAAAFRNPLLIGVKGGAVNFGIYTKGWRPQEIQRVSGMISGGFYSGQTTNEIVRAINGTKSAKYANGVLNTSRANVSSMVRTSINHMSTQAKETFNKENDDLIIGVRIVATLDSKTSDECKSRDGLEYFYKDNDYIPLPAYHINCRTTTSPLLSPEFDFLDRGATRAARGAEGGQKVAATQTYYEFLNNQPATFQNDALGVTKGRIFRNSGLSPEEFRKASVDRFNEPLNLQQMIASNTKIADYMAK